MSCMHHAILFVNTSDFVSANTTALSFLTFLKNQKQLYLQDQSVLNEFSLILKTKSLVNTCNDLA